MNSDGTPDPVGPRWDYARGGLPLPRLGEAGVGGGGDGRCIGVHHYAHDPLIAPEGGLIILVRYRGDYDRWESLSAPRAAYKAEKERLLEDRIRALKGPLPGLGARVKVTDVAAPTMCVWYTGSWRGSMQPGFSPRSWPRRSPQVSGSARLFTLSPDSTSPTSEPIRPRDCRRPPETVGTSSAQS